MPCITDDERQAFSRDEKTSCYPIDCDNNHHMNLKVISSMCSSALPKDQGKYLRQFDSFIILFEHSIQTTSNCPLSNSYWTSSHPSLNFIIIVFLLFSFSFFLFFSSFSSSLFFISSSASFSSFFYLCFSFSIILWNHLVLPVYGVYSQTLRHGQSTRGYILENKCDILHSRYELSSVLQLGVSPDSHLYEMLAGFILYLHPQLHEFKTAGAL